MSYNYNEDLSTKYTLIPGDKFMVYDRKSNPSKTRVRSKNKAYNIFVSYMPKYSSNKYPHSYYCFNHDINKIFGRLNIFTFYTGEFYRNLQSYHDKEDSTKAFKLSDLIGNSRLSYNLKDNIKTYVHSIYI